MKKFLALVMCSFMFFQAIDVYAEELETEMSSEELEAEISSLESELQDLYDLRDNLYKDDNASEYDDSNAKVFTPDDDYVKAVYFWTSPHGSNIVTYRITNPNDIPIYYKMETIFKNSHDEAIGTAEKYVRCLGPGEDYLIYSSNEDPFTKVSYTVHTEGRAQLESAREYMSYSAVEGTNKITFTVTNTGTKKINYAEIEIFYYQDGEPVNFFSTYLSDGSSYASISAGGTAYEELYYSPDYDSYEVYLSGYYE